MLKLSSPYGKVQGPFTFEMFDVIPDLPEELDGFLAEYESALNGEGNRLNGKLSFKMVQFESVLTLVRRYNLFLRGEKSKADKVEFLDKFTVEAITAIIYATDLAPRQMPLQQYAGLVLSTYERYADSEEFGKRVLELLNCNNHVEFGMATRQIELFINLLSHPEELDNYEIS